MRVLFFRGIFLAALLGGLSSCVKEVELDTRDQTPDLLVFHGYWHADSLIRVELGKVAPITSSGIKVNDAEIFVKINDVLSGKMMALGNGEYELPNVKIRANDRVNLNFKYGSIDINKTLKVPSNVVIKRVDTFQSVVGFIGKTPTFRINFKDSAYNKNAYVLNLWEKRRFYVRNAQGTIVDSTDREFKVAIEGNELPFLRNRFNEYTTKEILFDDLVFNGLDNGFEFYMSAPELNNSGKLLERRVVLENIDKELFDFWNLRNAHLWQQNSITQTPTVVKGNLGSCLGVWGLLNSDQWIIKYQ
jgi:hypothetical protein